MRVLLAAAAVLALALPGQASAADSLVLLAHGQVTFSAPTAGCPGGQATTQVTVASTGQNASAVGCASAPTACGTGCVQATITYTYKLRGGKIVARVDQQQYTDAAGSVAGVTGSGSVTKATRRFADLAGSDVAGGGVLFLNPDGSASADLAFSILAGTAGAATPAARPAATQVVTADGALTTGGSTTKCAGGTWSVAATLVTASENGTLNACVLSTSSCGATCRSSRIRLDGHFPSGNVRIVATDTAELDAAGTVTGEAWIGTVKRGSGVFEPLVGQPFVGGGALDGSNAHYAFAYLAT